MTRLSIGRHVAALGAAFSCWGIVFPTSAQRSWQTQGEQEAAEARRLAASGRCDAALGSFDTAIEKRSRDAALRRDRGYCHDKLGNPLPAIDDFRAYLSMDPKAPDASEVRRRLRELESTHLPESKPPDHDHDGRVEKQKLPEDLEDPFKIEQEEEEAQREPEGPSRSPSFLVGPYLGWRDWSDRGLANPTVSVGALGSYEYVAGSELGVRIAYLKTGPGGHIGDASGFGLTAFHSWAFGLDEAGSLDLLLGGGAGYERQSTTLELAASYVTVRAMPGVRWNGSDALSVQGGPEMAVGLMSRDATQGEEGSSDFALYYGVTAALLWRIGGRVQPAARPGSEPDPSARPDRDPDEPLEEDELWDD